MVLLLKNYGALVTTNQGECSMLMTATKSLTVSGGLES